MTLREARCKFAGMIAQLILHAQSLGYEVALDEGMNHQGKGHMAGSLHYIGLAQDVLLYKDGKYLTDTADYEQLGLYWLGIGGAWGGTFTKKDGRPNPDGNHFSLAWDGKK